MGRHPLPAVPSRQKPLPIHFRSGYGPHKESEMTKPPSNSNETIPRKEPYLKPTLEPYGQLRDLTTGGSGNAKESSSGKKPRP